jgi:hypothetical protein
MLLHAATPSQPGTPAADTAPPPRRTGRTGGAAR